MISTVNNLLFFSLYRDKPLALYLFSKNKADVNLILENTSSGGVCVNETVLHLAGNKNSVVLCTFYVFENAAKNTIFATPDSKV